MMQWIFGIIGAVVCGPIILALGDLASEEIRGRLDAIPRALLKIAIRRLPHLRDDLEAEWQAELVEFLHGAEALPITRLWRGLKFAAGLARVAPRIGRALGDAPAPLANLADAMEQVRVSGPPAHGDDFVRFFKLAYGVELVPAGSMPNSCQTTYRGPTGELITSTLQGACGTCLWDVTVEHRPGGIVQDVIRCRMRNETREVTGLRMAGGYRAESIAVAAQS
jgi:hypothetical protein